MSDNKQLPAWVYLLPPGVQHLHPQRLRPALHDGTETPEELAQTRPRVHGSMTLADGKTPMHIVTTEASSADNNARVHLFTTAPVITVHDRKVVFEGTHAADLVRPKRNRPPANYVPTPEIGKHLRDWSFLGEPVCTRNGDIEAARRNMDRYLLRHRVNQPAGLAFSRLCAWPLDERTLDTIDAGNWANDIDVHHPARVNLVTTVIMTAWMQTWATIMGRFLQQTNASRQTWPILLRYHELSSAVYHAATLGGFNAAAKVNVAQDALGRPSHVTSFAGNHMVSKIVEDSFPTFVKLSAGKRDDITACNAEIMAMHREEWLKFLTTHSFSDVLFAWLYMNLNDKNYMEVCDEMKRKIHQWWMTRHWIVHEFDNEPSRDAPLTSYVVIQSMSSPKMRMLSHKNVTPFHVLCMSHPVVKPGMPVFANPMMPQASLFEPGVAERVGVKAYVEALSVVWDINVCMTVAQQRQFQRVMFSARGGGVFSDILTRITCDVPIAYPVRPTSPIDPRRHQRNSPVRRSMLRNTSLAGVAGLEMSNRGPRNEGRVVQLLSATSLEHVNRGLPQVHRGHPSLASMARVLGCHDAPMPDETMWRNSQSVFAPNHDVDTGRFLCYLEARLENEHYQYTLQRILKQGRARDVVERSQSRRLDLGAVYFSILAHSNNENVYCEYDVWAALLAFMVCASKPHLPETMVELCEVFPRFWCAFNVHWHRYLRLVGTACTKLLVEMFTAIGDLDVRRTRFMQWVHIELWMSRNRLKRFGPHDVETKELNQQLRIFLLRNEPRANYMLFFYLTHVLQPVPLDPAYFVAFTQPTELQRIKSITGNMLPVLADMTSAPVTRLQHAVSHALLFCGVLWTNEVNEAWKAYQNAVSAELQGMSLVQTILAFSRASESPLEIALTQYALSHTVAVFSKQEPKLPTGTVDLNSIDDWVLSRFLSDVETPEFTVFLRIESRADVKSCEEIYCHCLSRQGQTTFQFAEAPLGVSNAQLKCPGDPHTTWQEDPQWITKAKQTLCLL